MEKLITLTTIKHMPDEELLTLAMTKNKIGNATIDAILAQEELQKRSGRGERRQARGFIPLSDEFDLYDILDNE